MAFGDSNAPRRAGAWRQLASCMSDSRILLGLYVLLAIGGIVTAQEALPSTAPSLSSSPSFPTVSPSSHMPSQSPSSSSTLSAKPSISPSPSFSPSKTFRPSQSPGPTRTGTPSMTPVISPKISTADLFNIAMVLDGFPFINATNNVTSENRTLWETITSGHVATYWAKRNYTDFNITAITTNFETQVNWFTDEDTATSTVRPPNQTKIVYDQRIMYTVTGTDNPIFVRNVTNETVLFSRPFVTDSQRYCDDLQKAFGITNRIFLTSFRLIPFETPPPSPSSPPNGDDGSTVEGLGGGVVAAIVVACVAFVALPMFFSLWYWRRRKRGYIEQDDHVGEPGAMVIVDEPPGFRPQDSEYSEPATNDDPVVSDSHIPEREETEDMDENDQQHDQQDSLHVGIPLEDEGQEGLLSDDDEDSYYSEEDLFPMSSVQRPSMSGFALQIHELED